MTLLLSYGLLAAPCLPKIVTPHPHGVLSNLYYAKQPAVALTIILHLSIPLNIFFNIIWAVFLVNVVSVKMMKLIRQLNVNRCPITERHFNWYKFYQTQSAVALAFALTCARF